MLLTTRRSPIGATAPASPRTRRSSADAGKIPATLLPRPRRRDASSLGPRPAHSRLAVPPREHQSGGPPIHAAPTRSWPTLARPPPTGHLADAPCGHQELLTGGSHLTAPFHIRRSSGSGTASATSATSATTGCSCYCTAASAGRHTAPYACEGAPPSRWRRAVRVRRTTLGAERPFVPPGTVRAAADGAEVRLGCRFESREGAAEPRRLDHRNLELVGVSD